jgi:hypothetical protein
MTVPKVIFVNIPTTATVLAVMIVGAVIGEAVFLSLYAVPEANKEMLSSVLGSLNTLGLGLVAKFYFDSTKAQMVKDEAAAATAVATAADADAPAGTSRR